MTGECTLCKCNPDGTTNCGEHCTLQCEDGYELVNHDADDGVCCSCRLTNATEYCEEPAGVFRMVSVCKKSCTLCEFECESCLIDLFSNTH